jgi:uncharacterized membrane-anchored protein YhcB (DUF1043 family)
MPVLDFVVAIALGMMSFLLLLNRINQKQVQQELEDAFYQLLKSENGKISLIQLATAARVDAELTRRYLDHQAKAFDATLEVDVDGDTFYRFPKLN